jgi:hypothetical protein
MDKYHSIVHWLHPLPFLWPWNMAIATSSMESCSHRRIRGKAATGALVITGADKVSTFSDELAIAT